MKKHLVLIFSVFILLGCDTPNKEILKTQNILIGTWELDSVSTVRIGIQKSGNQTEIIRFINKEDFDFKWWQGDVGGEYEGKYFVHFNPKRGLKTVVLIPDTTTIEQGTLRRKYNVFDILELEDERLVTLEESEFIPRKDEPYLLYTKKKIFKKKLSPTPPNAH
ncbi:hypothetical protein [Pontibacter pamirensis]|uniref:hypothetical protein n=1 Tax=Pontibacter pamirensis TaxID=2562824 RepID=UPI001389A797|nr:hypothetical protein [Pontibacter pamirensis]